MANELDPSLELWRTVIATRAERAIRNSATYLDGYPSSTGEHGGSNDSGGRTQATALRHVDLGDRHGELRRRIERWVKEGADLCDHLAPSNKAQDHMASLAEDKGCPPGNCESCFRDHGYQWGARSEGSTRCKFCYRWQTHFGWDYPPLFFVEKYHRGQRITERDVNRALAEHRK